MRRRGMRRMRSSTYSMLEKRHEHLEEEERLEEEDLEEKEEERKGRKSPWMTTSRSIQRRGGG